MVACRDPEASKLPWKWRKRWGPQDSGAPRNGPPAINQSTESPYHTRAESTGTSEEEKQSARGERAKKVL